MSGRCVYFDLDEVRASDLASAGAIAGADALLVAPAGTLWDAEREPERVADRRSAELVNAAMRWLERVRAALDAAGAWRRQGVPLLEVARYDLLWALLPELQRWQAASDMAHRLGCREVTWIARPRRGVDRRELEHLAEAVSVLHIEVQCDAKVARPPARDLAMAIGRQAWPHLERLRGLAGTLRRRNHAHAAQVVFTDAFANSVHAAVPVAAALADANVGVAWLSARPSVREALAGAGVESLLVGDGSAAAAWLRTWLWPAERRGLAAAIDGLDDEVVAWPEGDPAGAGYLRGLLGRRLPALLADAARWVETYAAEWRCLRPAVVVSTTYSSAPGRAAALTAAAAGARSVYLQHGVIPDRAVYAWFCNQVALLWGEHDRRTLARHGSAVDARVVGATIYDPLAAATAARPAQAPRPGEPIRIALMASRTGGMVSSVGNSRRTLRAVAQAVREVAGARLTVKAHPGDATDVPEQVLREFPEHRLLRGGSSQEAILDSDIVIVVSSTTGFEACVAERPLVVLDLTGMGDVADYAGVGAALRAGRPEELAPALRSILESGEVRERLAAGRRRLLDDRLAGGRGGATAAAAACIRELAG